MPRPYHQYQLPVYTTSSRPNRTLAKIRRTIVYVRKDICKVFRTMNIGDARVSTDDEDLSLQLETLKGASCRQTY